MPAVPKAVMWAGGALVVVAIIWLVAKTLLPFTVGALCGAAATYLWKARTP